MKRIIKLIHNHLFWFCVGLFLLFICFFSDHSYYELRKIKHQQSEIRAEIASYRDSIAEYEAHIEEVSGDTKELEKFAREKLMMKKANEDVYIIE
ncbi:MAG: septum formation initiator family protein [Bacteroidales bacterium]|nr:septum formation initiator family protein [Bacteroidales bacterium]